MDHMLSTDRHNVAQHDTCIVCSQNVPDGIIMPIMYSIKYVPSNISGTIVMVCLFLSFVRRLQKCSKQHHKTPGTIDL